MVQAIEFENVSKNFNKGTFKAVHHVSFSIGEGEFITILGASGSGKTTLLKLVNRLYEADGGRILLFGNDIKRLNVVSARRQIGYVIQQVGLFPHLTIAENIAVVPKLLKWNKQKTDERIDELLKIISLDPSEHRNRYPQQLSGGQQQRVGLARALAADPKIMLLDEPFGAIDSITRSRLQDELLQIHGGLKKTFLFVTHDIEEAFKLGDRVIIMNDGQIVQFDTPEKIINAPANDYVDYLVRSAREKAEFWRKF